jgi:hypothetical protein
MNKINLDNFNYYGFDHDKVISKFEGDLTYIGTFCIKNEDRPRAIYFNSNPDRSKLHKDYMTLQSNGTGTYVSGIDKEDLEQYRYQYGLKCSICKDVIYSITRHSFRNCECKNCFVDGGRSYLRYGYESGKDSIQSVKIDLITGEYTEIEVADSTQI